MEFKFYDVMNLPVVIINDFYSDTACELIWQELCFLNNDQKMSGPEKTGTAFDKITNIPLKQNLGIMLDEIYADRKVSNILKENRKIFQKDIVDHLVDYHVFFRYLINSTMDNTVVQYYENSNFYKPHTDFATITAISWFYERPKKFQGGRLFFEDDSVVDCNYNRMIIFPSVLFHSVEEIIISDSDRNQNFGRYSITQLISVT
jgi:Rps23 Pro-64 3,4-dihydroxylase Tpa1-like proline 4-hydroxylase